MGLFYEADVPQVVVFTFPLSISSVNTEQFILTDTAIFVVNLITS